MSAGLLAAGLISPATASSTTCTHLLVDPAGDVDTTFSPTVLVPTNEVDLISADLRTTKKEVSATVELKDLEDEGTSLTDRSYEVDFTTNGQRYLLEFEGGRPYNDAYAWHVVLGDDNPEQSNGAGAQSAEGVGPTLGFTVDRHRNTVTMRFARDIFDKFGGIGSKLTGISASAWWGNGVKPTPESGFAGTYGSSDFGYSAKVYRDGAASCVR